MPEQIPIEESVAQNPLEKQAENALAEMNKEAGEFLSELDVLDKKAENMAGEEGDKLREQLKNLRKEANQTLKAWTEKIYAVLK